MNNKITAAVLALLAAAFAWQAFAKADCFAACKAKYEACMKQLKASDDETTKLAWQTKCELDYGDCRKACK